MTKINFIILLALAFTACLFFECSDTYKSETVRMAEMGEISTRTPTLEEEYRIKFENDSMKVYDPNTDLTVYAESLDNDSAFISAILKDNQ